MKNKLKLILGHIKNNYKKLIAGIVLIALVWIGGSYTYSFFKEYNAYMSVYNNIYQTYNSQEISRKQWDETSVFDVGFVREIETNSDGTFSIMQIADTHLTDGYNEIDLKVLSLIEKAIKSETPNLVVATGDLVWKENNYFALQVFAELME